MTKEEIMAMPAGREMDALVAEKVMGADLAKLWWFDDEEDVCLGLCYFHIDEARNCGWLDNGKSADECRESRTYREICPAYSTDIAAAWEVFKFFGVQGAVYFSGTDWWCEIQPEVGGEYAKSPEEVSAPLAICRAALLALMQ